MNHRLEFHVSFRADSAFADIKNLVDELQKNYPGAKICVEVVA